MRRVARAGLVCSALSVVGFAADSPRPPPAGATPAANGASAFYVDPATGRDNASGQRAAPFRTLEKALAVVDARVKQGLRSDKIYLRGGVYRNDTTVTKWRLNLRGTPDDYAVLSAMPAAPGAPGAVQRKDGAWFEKVVFDDAQTITTAWTPVSGHAGVWQTQPGFVPREWPSRNLWAWRKRNPIELTPNDATPNTSAFTVAPYMLLQDDEATLWADYLDELSAPGMRTYDHKTGTLYLRPLGDKDPNACTIETWYGGVEPDGEVLLLDGEGRSFFDGDLDYAALRGFEFRMFTRIFELHRRGYAREADRVRQRHVIFEDNLCRYGWIHLLLDANTVFQRDEGRLIHPRYADRSDWLVRNNVFFRPAREVFQIHGDNHVFEHNDVIRHGGPWAGPAALVSVVNARNSRNLTVRCNYIEGQGDNRWFEGSVFMFEIGRDHADSSGDTFFGGQTYEYNCFADLTAGPAFVLGKGDVRLTNLTIRGNIFAGHQKGPAILLVSPHANLRIEDNIFYRVKRAIVAGAAPEVTFVDRPTTGLIRGNVFVQTGTAIDPALARLTGPGGLAIEHNHFDAAGDTLTGADALTGDPGFRDPEALDFRPRAGAVAPLGPYDAQGNGPAGTEWWLRRRAASRLGNTP